MTRRQYPNLPVRQSGAALVISLIILTVITVLSVSAMRSTTLETKIAVNQQFKQLSFQAAESAFARLLGVDPDVEVPGTVTAAVEPNPDYYKQVATSTPSPQPGSHADVDMDLLEISPPGKYKFSGFGLSVITVIYQADATGHVTGNEATTHNRMEVALVRD